MMSEDILLKVKKLPHSTKAAVPYFRKILSNHIIPELKKLQNKIDEIKLNGSNNNDGSKEESAHIANSFKKRLQQYSLCSNQITKCSEILADVFKKEIQNDLVLEESRSWATERIFCCLEKLNELNIQFTAESLSARSEVDGIEKPSDNKISPNISASSHKSDIDDDFISWVDDALDLLDNFSKLFLEDTDTGNKSDNDDKWGKECAFGLLNLRGVVREMVSAAMNISQNFLPVDQKIVNARCHVVLRESKNFISEIFDDPKFSMGLWDNIAVDNMKIKDNLHHPTVRMFNDIVKDAIYNLEASVNRGVLGLVLTCLVNPYEALENLIQDQVKRENNSEDPVMRENSILIKQFDILNERLLQIGLFAISCSADKERVSNLRSCLASFEALESHLVPSLLSDPSSLHTELLVDHWISEVNLLRTMVFLIVDPTAFIEILMEFFHAKLNILKREVDIKWTSVQYFIGLGKCILDYLTSYLEYEPNAFPKLDKLTSIVEDLKKVVKECRVVCDLFLEKPISTETNESTDTVNTDTSKTTENEKIIKQNRIMKRLKLLYTLLSRVASEIIDENTSFENSNTVTNVESDTENHIVDSEVIAQSINRSEKNDQKETGKNKGLFKIFEKFKMSKKSDFCSEEEIREVKNDITHIKNDRTTIKKPINKTYSRSSIARVVPKNRKRLSASKLCPNLMNSIAMRLENTLNAAGSIVNHFSVSQDCLNKSSNEFLLADVSCQVGQYNKVENCENITGKSLGLMVDYDKNPTKNRSVFYGSRMNVTRKLGNSLRKKLLVNRMENNLTHKITPNTTFSTQIKINQEFSFSPLKASLKDSLNSTMDLHITDILEQLTGLSDTMSLLGIDSDESTVSNKEQIEVKNVLGPKEENVQKLNVLTLKINHNLPVSPKKVWNIRVTDDKENSPQTPLIHKHVNNVSMAGKENVECELDLSFASDIATPERLNDLNQLEQKLANLKTFWDH